MDRYSGTLECVIESKNKITMKETKPEGVFLTKFIVRDSGGDGDDDDDDQKEDK